MNTLLIVAALGPLLVVVGKLTSSIGTIMTVLGGLSAPILAAVAVIGVLVAAFIHLWNTNEEFRNNIIAIWNNLKTNFEEFGQGIVDRLNEMGFNFKDFGEVVKAVWNALCDFLGPIFEATFANIATILEGALDVMTGLFDIFAGLFSGDWEQVWNGVKEVFTGVWDTIQSLFSNGLKFILDEINTVSDKLNSATHGKISFGHIDTSAFMASGGVLTSGSAIVGEAGPEFVQVSDGRAMVQPLGNNGGDIAGLLETYLPYLAERTALYMDSGALVGSIAPSMNGALGNIAIRSGNR